MTPDAFRASLARLGLTIAGAARLFGVHDRTARRWASGDQDIPKAVELALVYREALVALGATAAFEA